MRDPLHHQQPSRHATVSVPKVRAPFPPTSYDGAADATPCAELQVQDGGTALTSWRLASHGLIVRPRTRLRLWRASLPRRSDPEARTPDRPTVVLPTRVICPSIVSDRKRPSLGSRTARSRPYGRPRWRPRISKAIMTNFPTTENCEESEQSVPEAPRLMPTVP